MVSGIEGVGEAVTGSMVARAVEPEAGEVDQVVGGNCLNCGAELTGPYCHQCGQKGHVHRTITAFWHDLAHSVLHFEGKIWRTLPLLAWRPGELTRRYVDGERARFVSPIALFLFSVFLMFAIFSLVGGPFSVGGMGQMPPQARAEAERDFNREKARDIAAIDGLRAQRARRAAAGRSTASIDAEIRSSEEESRLKERLFRQTMGLIASEPPGRAGAADQPRADIRTNIAWLDRGIQRMNENPSLLAYKLQTNAYKFSWALIPISVPFVWLLFLHRRRYRQYKAYDHVVFVTYSIAFMSLALIALSLLRPLGLGGAFIGLAITFLPPIHMYRQLRGAYALSRLSALWRTVALLFFAVIAASLFFMLLLALGVLG